MNVSYGIALALFAGTLNGLFPLPMKAVTRWEWECIWLPFTVLSLVIFPGLIAWSFAPHLDKAISHLAGSDIVEALLVGCIAYTGSLMFGLAIPRIGAGLSFALLVGTMNAAGVLVPRLLLHRVDATTAGDRLVFLGIALSLASVGSGYLASKGKLTEADSRRGRSSSLGALLAIMGGALSGLLPIGMAMPWAGRAASSFVHYGGTSTSHAATVALSLVLLGGAIPNCAYCAYLLHSRKTYQAFTGSRSGGNWWLVLSMGIFYSASHALWGIAISPHYLGLLGPSIGWGLYVGMIVAASTSTGLISGEWKGASGASFLLLAASLVLLAGSMALICLGTYRS